MHSRRKFEIHSSKIKIFFFRYVMLYAFLIGHFCLNSEN